ncbi:hypothetical protein [Sorangium atrum]|uniref:Uncharacterized protein n=1 Tax=Sorangium atrum TaxID=2995308 RepID=A0ABT5C201_9BACT|nr:hypothetical protein [Sorangium aterium]MDC0680367.1 hypothetical protein [Sorangium aterium]
MSIRSMFGALLNLGEARPSEAAAQVDRARAVLAAAERDAAETGERLAEREAHVAKVEAAFDEDPSDANGAAVISARNSRDLAKLQADRAARREQQAREALAQAEHEAERARLEAQLAEIEQRHHAALEAERSASAARLAAHPARAVLEAIRSAEERQRHATAEHATAAAALDASAAELAELEAKVMAIAPDRAEELRARAERRTGEQRDALAARASLAAAKVRFMPSVELVIAGEALIRKSLADIDAAVEDARAAAKRAQELGADIKPIDDFHKLCHVRHAQFIALPEEVRNWNGHYQDIGHLAGISTPFGRVERAYRFQLEQPKEARRDGDVSDAMSRISEILNSHTTDEVRAAEKARYERQEAERQRRFEETYIPPPPGGIVVSYEGGKQVVKPRYAEDANHPYFTRRRDATEPQPSLLESASSAFRSLFSANDGEPPAA